MKKAMVLAVSVLLILLGSVGYAVAQITQKEDQVQITEAVRYGDPTQAYGLTAGMSTTLDYHLFWDTTHTFGETSQTHTDMQFYPIGQIRSWPEEYYLNLRDSVGGSMNAHGNWTGITEVEKESLSGLELALYELAQKTQAGEENSARIRLGDYYAYYPMEIELQVEDIYYNDWDFERALEQETYREERDAEIRALYKQITEFFKIPVLPDEYMEIHLKKNAEGIVNSWGYSSGGKRGYSLYTQSSVAENAVYFSIHNRDRDGEIVDTGLIPGGYGLYCLPFIPGDEEKETLAVLCPEKLEMVYALPEEEQVCWLRVSEDQQRLILITSAEETFTIRVIRREDMTTMQVLSYPGEQEEIDGSSIFWEEDHLLLRLRQGKLMLFAVEADGTFELKFSVALDPTGELELPLWSRNAVTDWNGEKLAVLMGENIDYGRPDTVYCSAELAVYDNSGLLYCGKLGSSLDTEPGRQYYSRETVMPVDYQPLTIAWDK